jgi:hypothetical protein
MPDENPEIKQDGHRQFWGKPQQTDAEIALLERVKRDGLQLAFTPSGPIYLCRGRKVDKKTARRLIDYHYVIPDIPGLFGSNPAQTWRARPDPVAPPTPTPTSTRLRAHLGRYP